MADSPSPLKQALPTGTVTFLFTDIEGSTWRWEQHPDLMRTALERHDSLLQRLITEGGGRVFRRVGDAFYSVFPVATQALTAARAIQLALQAEQWSEEISPLRVRIALHTGIGEVRDDDYVGQPLNRVARLLSVGSGGQILLSQTTYALVRDSLPEGFSIRDLGEHRLKDLQREEHIFQMLAPDLPSEFPALKTLNSRPNNLPVERSPLINREKELVDVRDHLLDPQVGLLTLTGPGGIGKTRLALQVAADIVEQFQDGVFFVPLASISAPDLVPSTIAQALGLRESGGQPPMSILEDYLRDKDMLLVLDNFEQVAGAAPTLARLIDAAPKLTLLVTSRASLNLYGEHEIQVPALSYPEPSGAVDIEGLARYDAVRLFVARAMEVRPDFRLTPENTAAVAEICRRLDGLPLAIELAAARIKLLPPQAMLSRLENRLKVLTGGPRDSPVRQQTLHNTIEWSYDLLNPEEQILFERLSVFAGGCTLEAAEIVCAAGADSSSAGSPGSPGSAVSPVSLDASGVPGGAGGSVTVRPLTIDILDGVESLVNKSLLRQYEIMGAEPRFRMLETIREYGLEKLAEHQEAGYLQQQHAQFFLALAERAEPYFLSAQRWLWMLQLSLEQDNLRSALAWSEANDSGSFVRMAGSLAGFWFFLGAPSEGRRWMERAQVQSGLIGGDETAQQRTARAMVSLGIGGLAWSQADYEVSRTSLDRSLSVFREQKDTRRTLYTLTFKGLLCSSLGDAPAAASAFEESLKLAKELNDLWLEAYSLRGLGDATLISWDLEKARELYERSLAIMRSMQDQWIVSLTLQPLGLVAIAKGEFAKARSIYSEAAAAIRGVGDKWGLGFALVGLASVAIHEGNFAEANALLRESLQMWREIGNRSGMATLLEGLANVAVAQGELPRAATLLVLADRFPKAFGDIPFATLPIDLMLRAGSMNAVKAGLSEAEQNRAREAGQAIATEQVAAYALKESVV